MIFNPYGMTLAAHEPFVNRERAIEKAADIESVRRVVYQSKERLLVKDTDCGYEMSVRIEELKQLLAAYRNGLIIERSSE